MTDPKQVLKSIRTAIDESGRLPTATSYSTFELDTSGGQANVRPPVVEITTINTIRARPHNTDFVGFATDDNGNQIGRIYEAKFEMSVQIDVWTAEGDQYSPKDIGREIRYALYKYDDTQVGDDLPDPDDPSTTLSDVSRFTIGDGQVANDMSMSPTLRRWRQTADIWFNEVVNTADEYGAEDYIVTVVGPEDGEMVGGNDVEIIFDATPNTESEADNY